MSLHSHLGCCPHRNLEEALATLQAQLTKVESTLQAKLTNVESTLQSDVAAGAKALEAFQSSTTKQFSRMDSDIATLLDIISDLEKGGGAIMEQVTAKIKEVVDMIMAEQ